MALCDLKVQGGVTLTYTVGRSATGVVKVLTREILSLTLELLFKSVLSRFSGWSCPISMVLYRRLRNNYFWMRDVSSGVGSYIST